MKIVQKMSLIMVIFTLFIGLTACKNDTDDDPNPNPDPSDYEATLIADKEVTETFLRVFEGPEILDSSEDVSIQVEGQDIFVYDTLVNHGRVFTFTEPTTTNPVAIFDFEGRVEVTLTYPSAVTSAVVRPLAYGIEPTVSGNTVTFELDYPTQYSVEINDDSINAVHIFASEPETDPIDPNNVPDDVTYIGPGVWKADAIPVEDNTTVYIAGGAVVYGQIHTEEVDNLTIRGRGIISGDIYERNTPAEATIPLVLRNSTNVTIEGISFLNSAGWTVNAYFVDGLTIDNIKVITARANGDGISLQSCHNVVVKNSFVRAWDDALVVKNYDEGTTDNILFENVQVWTDLAQSMEIGYETYGATMNNITFRDITVLHNFHKPVMSIHNADNAVITNVLFENITVEDAQMVGDNSLETYDDFLFEFFVKYNQVWSSSGGERGSVDGVTVNNVHVIDGKDSLVSFISGYDANHTIENVAFNNVTYLDTKVESAEDLNLTTNQFTDNITYSYNIEEPRGARLHLPYTLNLTDDTVTIDVQETITQEGFLVPEFAIGELPSLYVGQEIVGNYTATATRGESILIWDDGSGDFSATGFDPNAVLDEDTTTIWKAANFTTDSLGEFAALNIDLDGTKTIGAIRLYGDLSSNLFVEQSIAIYGIKASSENNVYTKILNAENYEFSPATGNFVDINLNPGEYKAIQLRFYNRDGVTYPTNPFISEFELYPASLSFGKSVTGTPHEDVYEITNITDGSLLTYYESQKGTWPAEIIIDLESVSTFNVVTLHLPPLMVWGTRTMEVAILGSTDGVTYEEILGTTAYTFDPITGNVVEITLPTSATYQYVKLLYYSTTAPGGVAAQISEVKIFE
jgi:hypothetical protein